ncbi:MAG TPA: EAL domain-containing protein [Thermoanaerobaculia bacterium]|nr:EAL domain-containing protein [Thermoanaerobaculia bacterium]
MDAPDGGITLRRVTKTLRALARIAAIVPVAIGGVVLYGWAADVDALKRIINGLVAMNPATAIAFIFTGVSLALLTNRKPRTALHRAGELFAVIVALIGAVKCVALIVGGDVPVDQLLFHDKVVVSDFGLPNRMAPNTALNFLLLGVALMNIDRRFKRWWPSQMLTVVAAMSSLLALMGYAYGVKSFYGIGTYIPMALHTAATFFIVSAGILCVRPERGIMAVVSSATSGGVMIRRLLPAAIILPALVGWLRIAGTRARWFDADLGLWLTILVLMTVFAVLIGWNSRLLFRADVDRAKAEKSLAFQALHDNLTQLPNRRMFSEELERVLQGSKDAEEAAAVLFLDLDLFKVINDSLGHVVGDQLLVAAGQRIRETAGTDAMAARISGDEFTILLSGLTTRMRALELAGKLLSAFSIPFKVGPHEVFTTASIGVAFSEKNDTPVNLIRHADIAMYKAKANGKARFEIFDPAMDVAAMRRLQLEMEIRRAIDKKEFVLYYQPEVEISSGTLVGMEALIRWQHPERGLVPPSEFIATAEETGLILPISRWILYEACRQAREWQKKYRPYLALMVSINISGKHFQQITLIDEVADALKASGIDPSHVILEITETVAMAGAETTIEILTKLKSLGVLLAIDDFGTGFSSLSYLKRFPVDVLKIDKSFVDGVGASGPDNAIVQAIVALAHALGLKVIAEGVTTPEQVAQLRALGPEIGQGFFYSEPLSNDSDSGLPSLLK